MFFLFFFSDLGGVGGGVLRESEKTDIFFFFEPFPKPLFENFLKKFSKVPKTTILSQI